MAWHLTYMRAGCDQASQSWCFPKRCLQHREHGWKCQRTPLPSVWPDSEEEAMPGEKASVLLREVKDDLADFPLWTFGCRYCLSQLTELLSVAAILLTIAGAQ